MAVDKSPVKPDETKQADTSQYSSNRFAKPLYAVKAYRGFESLRLRQENFVRPGHIGNKTYLVWGFRCQGLRFLLPVPLIAGADWSRSRWAPCRPAASLGRAEVRAKSLLAILRLAAADNETH